MPANELTVSYANHEIRVVKTPTDGARLHIDGKLLDVTNDLFESEDEPTLVGMFVTTLKSRRSSNRRRYRCA
jgi:hypothetical protein